MKQERQDEIYEQTEQDEYSDKLIAERKLLEVLDDWLIEGVFDD